MFLNTSILRKFIQFSKGFDPLLLYPYRQLLTNSSTRMRNYDPVLKLFELGREMNTRIQQAEVILKEEQLMFDYPEIAEKILDVAQNPDQSKDLEGNSFKRLSSSAVQQPGSMENLRKSLIPNQAKIRAMSNLKAFPPTIVT